MEFKDKLKQYRLDNNLTQDELADKLFVSRQAISKYETGRGYPSIDVLTELAKLMGISVDELLTREELVKETQQMTETLHRSKKQTVIMAVCVALAVIIAVTTVVLSTTGIIAGINTYKVPENHCIVGLWYEFKLYSVNTGKLCEPIQKNIEGIDKDSHENMNTSFYSVVKGAEYIIIIDDFADNYGGYGFISYGIHGDPWLNAFWQGDIYMRLKKVYSEESGLQDEVFFTTNFKQINDTIKVTFNENCKVKGEALPFMYVGGVYEIAEKGGNLLDGKIYDYINEDGTLGSLDGLYYLMLDTEICVHQDAWKTNLDITDYKYEYVEINGRPRCIQAQFTAKMPVVGDNQELRLYTLCRTLGDRYFVLSPVYIDSVGFNMPIRENELKLSFE